MTAMTADITRPGKSGSPRRPFVLVMGACCLDRILSVDEYPRADSKTRTTSCREVTGGNGANVAKGLAMLFSAPSSLLGPSLEVVLLTSLGNDAAGSTVARDLERHGVRVVLPPPPPGDDVAGDVAARSSNVVTVISSTSDQTRTCLFTPGTCGEIPAQNWTEWMGPRLAEEGLRLDDAVWFHSDTRHTAAALAVAKECRLRGVPVSADVERYRGDDMRELVRLSTIAFGNEGMLRRYVASVRAGIGTSPARRCGGDGAIRDAVLEPLLAELRSGLFAEPSPSTRGFRRVVATRGRDGARQLSGGPAPESVDGEGEYRCCGSILLGDGERVVDTNGAGDAFIAAYLAAHLSPALDSGTTLEFAAWVAGRKCLGIGHGAFPTGKVVDETLGGDGAIAKERLGVLLT